MLPKSSKMFSMGKAFKYSCLALSALCMACSVATTKRHIASANDCNVVPRNGILHTGANRWAFLDREGVWELWQQGTEKAELLLQYTAPNNSLLPNQRSEATLSCASIRMDIIRNAGSTLNGRLQGSSSKICSIHALPKEACSSLNPANLF